MVTGSIERNCFEGKKEKKVFSLNTVVIKKFDNRSTEPVKVFLYAGIFVLKLFQSLQHKDKVRSLR